MEHRWGHRREANRNVYLKTHSGLVAYGILRDVSVSGAFIATPLPVGPFTRLQLFLSVEGRNEGRKESGHRRSSHHPFEGEVVRRTAEGIGIEWKELGNAIFVALGEAGALTGEITGGEPRNDAEAPLPSARKAR